MRTKPRITAEQLLQAIDLLILEELEELDALEEQASHDDTELLYRAHSHWQHPHWQTPRYQVQLEA